MALFIQTITPYGQVGGLPRDESCTTSEGYTLTITWSTGDKPCMTSEGDTHGATPLRILGVSQVSNQVCMTSGYYTTSIILRHQNNDLLVHNRGLHHCTMTSCTTMITGFRPNDEQCTTSGVYTIAPLRSRGYSSDEPCTTSEGYTITANGRYTTTTNWRGRTNGRTTLTVNGG